MSIKFPKNFVDPALDREKKTYDDPILSREGIIKLIEYNEKSVNYDELMGFYKSNVKKEALDFRLRAMVRDGQLVQYEETLTTLDYWPIVLGTIIKNDQIDAVLLLDTNKQVPLYRPLRNIIFNGDYCQVVFIEPLQQAALFKVIEGSAIYFDGQIEDPQEYDLPKGFNYAIKALKGPFKHDIVSGRALQDKILPIGQKVTCKLDRHNTSDYILVDIVQDFPLGLQKVIKNFNLPASWPPGVELEAKIFERMKIKPTAERKDLTELPLVTIDDITAKDFDDAVCALPLEDGRWQLYVAIADVAHYVKLGSAIDKEAMSRGVSVYFPQNVVPMLPEILSNELCSLKPNVLRYSLVCQMELTKDGEINSFEFYSAIIRSHARLTYDQVQERKEPANVKVAVDHLWTVFRLLNSARKRKGYVFFAQQSSRFVLGENEQPLDVYRAPSLESHNLIEEMMLAANKCAAQFLHHHTKIGVYRTHAEPSEQKVQLFNLLLCSLNLSLSPPYTLEKIAALSEQLREKHPRLSVLVSRIMQRASYETTPQSHFGLNFDLYSHFTSPIRRYPDLIVHRLIYQIINNQKNKLQTDYIPTALKRVNFLERRAEEAERLYHSYLKVRFIKHLNKKSFPATVTGLAEFGLFVELDEYPIDGMIHVSQLGNGYWQLAEEKGILTNSSESIRIGDHLIVSLLTADLEQLRINFKFVSNA